jgi:formate hydrogenlyase subunit 6/NADH:ubiquinone oxidoreductase subunit I
MMENVLKNLVSKPATRMYPFEKREPFQDSRGHISGCDIDKCIFCGICQRKCPADAIVVNKAEKSWEINQFKCVICNACVETCPKKCINSSSSHKTAQYSKDNLKIVQAEKNTESVQENA